MAELEHGLYGHLALSKKCGIAWIDGADPADMDVTLIIEKWLETERPGGARHFDEQTGRYVQGSVHEVEIHYRLRVTAGEAGSTPLREQAKTMRQQVASMRNVLWDPKESLVRGLHKSFADKIRKEACRAARVLEKRGDGD